METINSAIAQIRDLFRSMTPGARVTAGLLLAAVVVSLGYLFVGGTDNREDYLFGGEELRSSEIAAIEAALAGEQIPSDASGNRIRVPASRQYEAMAAIAAAGAMPLNLHEIMNKALNSGSFFESREQTKERLEAAKEQYLAAVIRSMDWVEDAAVNFEEKKGPGLQRQDLVTAAVAVTPRTGSIDPLQRKMLQELVAFWFAGLSPDKVHVSDLGHGGATAGNRSLELAELVDNPYLRAKFLFEEHERDKILSKLAYIGPGVHVEVNAEMTTQLASDSHTHKPDEKGTIRRTDTKEELTTNSTSAPAGRPGPVANGPQQIAQDEPNPTTEDRATLNEDTSEYEIGYVTQVTSEAGLTPKGLHASISIPKSWLTETIWPEDWKRRNPQADEADMPPPTAQELLVITETQQAQIQNEIEVLLPEVAAGEDRYPRVQVAFYDARKVTPTPEPTVTESAFAWTTAHWMTLAMFLLAVVSLFMLRSMVKSAGKAVAAERPTLQLDLPEEEPEEEEEGEERPRLRLNKGPTLKDDLAQLVREDPDTAAMILRAWISQAA